MPSLQRDTLHNPIARRVIGLWVLCGLVLLASVSQAAIVTVDKDGGRDHTTIAAAVSAANAGDTIEIYTGASAYNKSVTITKTLTIKAASGQTPLLTNLSTNQKVPVFEITSGVDNVVIEDLDFVGTGRNTSTRIIQIDVTSSNPITGTILRNLTVTDWCSNASSEACRFLTLNGDGATGTEVENTLVENVLVTGGRFDQLIRLDSSKNTTIRLSTFTPTGAGKVSDTACVLYVIKQASSQEPALTTGTRIDRVRVVVTDTTAATNAHYGMSDPNGCQYQLLEGDVNPDNATITRTSVAGTDEMTLIEPESRASNWIITHNILVGGMEGINTSGPGNPPAPGGGHVMRQNTLWDIDHVGLRQAETMTNVSWLGNAVVLTPSSADFFVLRDSNDANGTFDSTVIANHNYYLCDACSGTNRFRLNNPNSSDTRYTFAQWQSTYGIDANSTASNATVALFVNPGANDFNPATGSPLIGAYSDGSNIGALQEIVPLSAHMSGTQLTITFSVFGTFLPLQSPDVARLHVKYGGVGQTENSCEAGPNDDQVTCTMAAAPGSGDTVTYDLDYGFVQDSAEIGHGHDGAGLNSKSRAQTNQGVTNQSGGWVVGTNRTIPAGTDRLMPVAFCWEHGSPPGTLDFTNVQIGGQACTQVADQEAILGATTQRHNVVELWYCNEAALAAASSGLITYDTSTTPAAGNPEIVASIVVENINQVSPITDSDQAVTDEGNSVSTPALTTTSPDLSIYAVCTGSDGTTTPGAGWTERVDVAEDGAPSHRLVIATSEDTNVTPSMTFTSTDPDGTTRLPLVTASLNGGSGGGGGASTTRTQVSWRCSDSSEGLTAWTKLANTPCDIAPGGRINVMLQMEVSGAAEEGATEKKLTCRDDGGDAYELGDTFGSNLVAYADTEANTFANADVIPCPSPLGDSGGGGDCVTGRAYEQTGGFVSSQLGIGDRIPLGFSIQVSSTATSSNTVQCSLTPLDDSTNPLTITIHTGRAMGS